MIALARWLDITLPSSAVVDEAIDYRRRMKAYVLSPIFFELFGAFNRANPVLAALIQSS
jgi:hypothetical protein